VYHELIVILLLFNGKNLFCSLCVLFISPLPLLISCCEICFFSSCSVSGLGAALCVLLISLLAGVLLIVADFCSASISGSLQWILARCCIPLAH
jgi:hypothetical protein